MHKVAESTPGALLREGLIASLPSFCFHAHLILSTTCLPEVGDWGQFRYHRTSREPPIVQVLNGPFRILLFAKLNVNITHKMISEIVTHVHLLNLSVFIFQFNEHVLEEVIEMFLHLLLSHVRMRSISRLSCVLGVVVKILEEDGLRKGWPVMDPRASIPVATGADFEVEGTVNFVLFCAEN